MSVVASIRAAVSHAAHALIIRLARPGLSRMLEIGREARQLADDEGVVGVVAGGAGYCLACYVAAYAPAEKIDSLISLSDEEASRPCAVCTTPLHSWTTLI